MSVAKSDAKKKQFIADIRDALYASKIISYAQGYMLMRAAATEYNWNLNYGGIALMWRGGCIIRSRFLGKIKEAFDNNPKLTNLLLDDYFRGEIKRCQKGWRNVVAAAAKKGIPVPAFSTALAFYDQYRSARAAGQSVAGAARLFRRAHLRTCGQAARRVFPHQLDRPRRHHRFQHVQRLSLLGPWDTRRKNPRRKWEPIPRAKWTLSPQKSVGRKNQVSSLPVLERRGSLLAGLSLVI